MDDNIKFERRGVRLKGDHQFDRWMDGNIRCFFLRKALTNKTAEAVAELSEVQFIRAKAHVRISLLRSIKLSSAVSSPHLRN
jgi:hypothetical protein